MMLAMPAARRLTPASPAGQFLPLQPEEAAVLLAGLAGRDDLYDAGTPPRSTTQLAGALIRRTVAA